VYTANLSLATNFNDVQASPQHSLHGVGAMAISGRPSHLFTNALMYLLAVLSAMQASAFAQKAAGETLPVVLAQFQSARDLEAKERLRIGINARRPFH
jgi:hypothetical protein